MSEGPRSQGGPHKSSKFAAWCKHKKLPTDIDYSDKYPDDEHEFRHVILSAPAFKKPRRNPNMRKRTASSTDGDADEAAAEHVGSGHGKFGSTP